MMNYKIEVVTLPVADVDRAMAFYIALGFVVDVDYRPSRDYRVVQLTPPNSGCSIQFGAGLTDAAPGSARATYLVVEDLETSHRELSERGLELGPITHKAEIENWQGEVQAGIDNQHRDYASLSTFADPDGNTWVLQEVGHRLTEPAGATAVPRASGSNDER